MNTNPDEDVTLGEINRGLTRMELKLDTAIGDHEKRLRNVERWVYALPPTILVALAAVVDRIIAGN